MPVIANRVAPFSYPEYRIYRYVMAQSANLKGKIHQKISREPSPPADPEQAPQPAPCPAPPRKTRRPLRQVPLWQVANLPPREKPRFNPASKVESMFHSFYSTRSSLKSPSPLSLTRPQLQPRLSRPRPLSQLSSHSETLNLDLHQLSATHHQWVRLKKQSGAY